MKKKITETLRKPRLLDCLAIFVSTFPLVIFAYSTFTDPYIAPYDQSLFVANGRFFHSILTDFQRVLADPKAWLWEYYEQYPALALRRHPPAYGFLEGLWFSIFGATIQSARLCMAAVGCLFCTVCFGIVRVSGVSRLEASMTPWLIFSTWHYANVTCDIWLDLPALTCAFSACWVILTLTPNEDLQGPRNLRSIFGVMILVVLSCYTYLLSAPFLLACLIYWVHRDGLRSFLNWRYFTLGIVFSGLLLPLLYINLKFATDQIALITSGGEDDLYSVFKSKTPPWLAHSKTLLSDFPIGVFGFAGIFLARFFRRLSNLDRLMILCVVMNFLGYAFVPSFHSRYTSYIAIPLYFLLVSAISALLGEVASRRQWGERRKFLSTTALVIFFCTINFLFTSRERSRNGVNGFDEVIAMINQTGEATNVLYCGVMDAGFVMNAALMDTDRNLFVYKADGKVKTNEDLLAFFEDSKSKVVVYEMTDYPEHQRTRIHIRNELESFFAENPDVVESDERVNLHRQSKVGSDSTILRVIRLR